MTHDDFIWALNEEIDALKTMLIEKNRKYGNSALQPARIFAKSDAIEQLNVRIDDKLSRIKNQQADEDEDAEFDLLGYLLLKRTLINYNLNISTAYT
ncbi:hypothetical protein KC887_01980 [Candidatus Kaiserbacteria bacterium]|nr:hypothetical protein [Candidatus Kaiserbacteria bacterium]